MAIPNACSVISPKLKDICSIGFSAYQYYLSLLFMDMKAYFSLTGYGEAYENLSGTELAQLDLFDLLTAGENTRQLLTSALRFFIPEDIMYAKEKNCFLVCNADGSRAGTISGKNYALVCDVIRQRNHFKSAVQEDLTNIKNKKALVAGKSQTLNLLNIWDLTVFQLWDSFFRLSSNNLYAIQSMSVAAWGDKDKHFDAASWFRRINHEP